jgi:hypothetical protein
VWAVFGGVMGWGGAHAQGRHFCMCWAGRKPAAALLVAGLAIREGIEAWTPDDA